MAWGAELEITLRQIQLFGQRQRNPIGPPLKLSKALCCRMVPEKDPRQTEKHHNTLQNDPLADGLNQRVIFREDRYPLAH